MTDCLPGPSILGLKIDRVASTAFRVGSLLAANVALYLLQLSIVYICYY